MCTGLPNLTLLASASLFLHGRKFGKVFVFGSALDHPRTDGAHRDDIIGAWLIDGLSRPGGNPTGFTILSPELSEG
jgi:hypothetical protein